MAQVCNTPLLVMHNITNDLICYILHLNLFGYFMYENNVMLFFSLSPPTLLGAGVEFV